MARLSVKTIAPAWPDLSFETEIWQSGEKYIAGIDEAGRGAWAGPVTASAVILPCNDPLLSEFLSGVRDSKQMSANQREKWAGVIRQIAVSVCTGWAEQSEIDELGILPATRLAMIRAIDGLNIQAGHLLIDAVKLPELNLPQTSLLKGDARSLSIASASVIAKTERDSLMRSMENNFPGYGFAAHKGYGTVFHQKALNRLGVSDIHRKSYAPIKTLLEK